MSTELSGVEIARLGTGETSPVKGHRLGTVWIQSLWQLQNKSVVEVQAQAIDRHRHSHFTRKLTACCL